MNSLMQEKIIKGIIAVLTLLVTLAMIVLCAFSFKSDLIGLGIVSFMLAGFFGYFLYDDYLYFFKKQSQ
jgi:hypothetical protein